MSTDTIPKRGDDPPTDQAGAFICGRACEDGSRCRRTVSHPRSVCYSHELSDPVGTDPDDEHRRDRSLADGGCDRASDQPPLSETVDSRDELFALLSNQRRRDVLVYLDEHHRTTTLGELAVQLAAWENDTTRAAVTSAERQRVYVPLYQAHLPKLAAYGAIEYDQSRGTIERTDRADRFDTYLRAPNTSVGAQQDQESAKTDGNRPLEAVSLQYTGATVVLGSAVFAVAWLEVVPMMALLALSWLAIIGISVLDVIGNEADLPIAGRPLE
jgi:hypothetical protein